MLRAHQQGGHRAGGGDRGAAHRLHRLYRAAGEEEEKVEGQEWLGWLRLGWFAELGLG